MGPAAILSNAASPFFDGARVRGVHGCRSGPVPVYPPFPPCVEVPEGQAVFIRHCSSQARPLLFKVVRAACYAHVSCDGPCCHRGHFPDGAVFFGCVRFPRCALRKVHEVALPRLQFVWVRGFGHVGFLVSPCCLCSQTKLKAQQV